MCIELLKYRVFSIITSFNLIVLAFGDVFAGIGVREPQPNASEAFTTFGEAHREIERHAIKMLKTVKPVSLLTFKLQHTEYIRFAHY